MKLTAEFEGHIENLEQIIDLQLPEFSSQTTDPAFGDRSGAPADQWSTVSNQDATLILLKSKENTD